MRRWTTVWENYKEGSASAPTAQTESVLITTCINAMENRDVAITDAPGEFMKAHMEKEFHMLLYGDMDEAMRHIYPEQYANYV